MKKICTTLAISAVIATSSILSYHEETTNFELINKNVGWMGDKSFIVAHEEIFEKHCQIWGVDWSNFLNIVIADSDNLAPIQTLDYYISEKPEYLRDYTPLERAALLAYQSGYEECAMIAAEEINESFLRADKREDFHKSVFRSVFYAAWTKIISGKPQYALVAALFSLVSDYVADKATDVLWNPKEQIKSLRLLTARANKAEERLLLNKRFIF